MSKLKYENLKEEVEYNVITVDSERIQRNSHEVKIFLRDPFNKTTQISFDNSKIIKIQDLKTIIFKELKIEENKKIKLIFKGKILEDLKNISEYKIEKDDVLLYMIVNQEIVNNNIDGNSNENDTSVVSQHIQNGLENYENRGFNRFRTLGMSPYELNLFRTLFHAIYMSQHRNENIDWSTQAVLQREDEWINNQSPRNLDSGLSQQGIIAQRNLLDNSRLNAGRIIFLRQGINFNNPSVNNSTRTNNNTNNNQQNNVRLLRNNLSLRRINQDYNDFFIHNNEPNSRLILGFVLGILLHFYGLILLLFCNLKPKFKTGLQIGMIFGCIFFIFTYNTKF